MLGHVEEDVGQGDYSALSESDKHIVVPKVKNEMMVSTLHRYHERLGMETLTVYKLTN